MLILLYFVLKIFENCYGDGFFKFVMRIIGMIVNILLFDSEFDVLCFLLCSCLYIVIRFWIFCNIFVSGFCFCMGRCWC